MFVFGEVQDPLPETVKLVEDIVRGQIIEIVSRWGLYTTPVSCVCAPLKREL